MSRTRSRLARARRTWRRRSPRWSCASAATRAVPVSTINDYFVRDDFGVVQLLAQRAGRRSSSSGSHRRGWTTSGDTCRMKSARSRRLVSADGARRGRHSVGASRAEHRAARRERTAGPRDCRQVHGVEPERCDVCRRACSCCCRHTRNLSPGSPDASIRCRHFSTWRRSTRSPRSRDARSLSPPGHGPRAPPCGTCARSSCSSSRSSRSRTRSPWSRRWCLRPDRVDAISGFRIGRYGPFLAMTAGYLALAIRAVRSGCPGESAQRGRIEEFLRPCRPAPRTRGDRRCRRLEGRALWLVIASVVVVWWMARRHPSGSPRLADVMLFAGPVWWIIGVAPVAVAGYESPRHVYLAAAGWGLTLGAVFDVVRSWRPASVLAVRLHRRCRAGPSWLCVAARRWSPPVSRPRSGISSGRARRSRGSVERATGRPRHRRRARPELGLGATVRRSPAVYTHRSDVPCLHHLAQALHCCSGQWFDDTRRHLRNWSTGPAQHSVTLLRWTEQPGSGGRVTSADYPALPDIARPS